MSDKTEAELLGKVFKILGEQVNRDRRNIADEVWEIFISDPDNNPALMKADQALMDLELAEPCENCSKISYQDVEHDCD